jgi:hypothetical protein
LVRAIPLVKASNEFVINQVFTPEERKLVSDKMQEVLRVIEEMSEGLPK